MRPPQYYFIFDPDTALDIQYLNAFLKDDCNVVNKLADYWLVTERGDGWARSLDGGTRIFYRVCNVKDAIRLCRDDDGELVSIKLPPNINRAVHLLHLSYLL
jgi:hypothetical protein